MIKSLARQVSFTWICKEKAGKIFVHQSLRITMLEPPALKARSRKTETDKEFYKNIWLLFFTLLSMLMVCGEDLY
ncbi:MAG: hypothetical protein IJU12_09075, partial [Clostridia bacterium]|nr:hypothetical protein [Clostridia bacterium]